MTQEKKQLVLKTLCSMLPYGVKVQVYDNRYAPVILTQIDVKKQECIFNFNVPVENCLPYLRSMSSMTEKEKEEYCDLDYLIRFATNSTRASARLLDFCNSHHLDYNGLIPMGLALEAHKDMYNIK